ncbi:hypothetical protein PFISCL1PPCAC_1779, partial [Pristionchus fissidentatus]
FQMRVRRSIIDGDSDRFHSPPHIPFKDSIPFRRVRRQAKVITVKNEPVEVHLGSETSPHSDKRDVIEQSTIGDGGSSTKVNGGSDDVHSDLSLVAGSDVADTDHSHGATRSHGKKEGNCNDLKMRKMITDHIEKNPKESKKAIQKAIEKAMGGTFSVICSPCEFSFVIRSESYCDGFKNQIACFAYRDEDE